MVRPGSSNVPEGDQHLVWDPEHGIDGLSEVEPIDAFVHLAGRSIASRRWSDGEKKLIRRSRVDATQVLADQISTLSSPPKVFVSTSAVGIYGECGDRLVEDDHPIDDTGDFLGEVARDWEAATAPLVQHPTVRVVHPRLGIVMTPEGGALGKVLPLFKNFLGGRLGSGSQYWAWVSMRDCVDSIIWMLETETATCAYNVVAPNPVTNLDFTQQLASAVGRPVSLPVPAFALRLAMGEMADALLLRSCRAVPSRLLQSGFAFRDSDFGEYLERDLNSDG
ncbi:MAG: hypothetical protein Aurels2KO_35290 [Aureliella sp.]